MRLFIIYATLDDILSLFSSRLSLIFRHCLLCFFIDAAAGDAFSMFIYVYALPHAALRLSLSCHLIRRAAGCRCHDATLIDADTSHDFCRFRLADMPLMATLRCLFYLMLLRAAMRCHLF